MRIRAGTGPRAREQAGSHASTYALVATLACLVLSGCAIAPPAPWEKGLLARPAMQMDTDPLEQRAGEHIYTSKENSSGGYAVGGGGCGCN